MPSSPPPPAPPARDFLAEDPARTRRATALVLIATALTFLTSLGGGFIWDDLHLIAYNRHLQGFAGLRYALTHHLWDVETVLSDNAGVRYYRPAVGALFVALRSAFGLNPAPYHGFVVALHLAAVALAARFLARALGPRPLPVALGAALFALHATRSQSVTWISGVSDVLMALPAIAAFIAVLPPLGVASPPTPEPRNVARISALTLCALAAKETAVVLPLAYATIVLATWPVGLARRRAIALYAGAPLALSAVYYAAREIWLPIGGAGGAPGPFRHAMIVLETLGRYAALVVWPWPIASFRTALALDASHEIRVLWGWSLLGLAALVAAVWALARAKKYRIEVAGIALALVLVAPVLNVRWTGYVELVGDRFLYLPMLGLALSLGALARRVDARAQRAVILAAAGILLAHASSVALKAADYRDEMAFWSAENELQPGVPRVLLGLAGADQAAGRDGRAYLELRQAYAAMFHYRAGPASQWNSTLLFSAYVGLKLIPDRDRQGLVGLLTFVHALDDPRAHTARGILLGDPIAIEGVDDPAMAPWLQTEAGTLRGMESGILSRLGRPADAVAVALEGVARCVSRCTEAYAAAALSSARAGQWGPARSLAARARALSPGGGGPLPVEEQIAAAEDKARLAAATRSPEERALREAESLIALDLPEAARERIEPFADSPATAAARIRIALMEYQFEQAHALARTLPPPEGPAELRDRRSLEALEIVQRQRIAGVESLVGAR